MRRTRAGLLALAWYLTSMPNAVAQSDTDAAVQRLRALLEDPAPAADAWPVRREYDPIALEAGQRLFRRNCALCHGWGAEGTVSDWQKRDANGKYPPPPLNGTAHAWHHPIPVLLRTLKEGTIPLGGSMPPWQEKLDDTQMLAIIQWITSLWPEDIYDLWLQRSGLR